MLSFSTGLLNSIIGERGFGAALYGGVVRLYTGQRPVSADLAIPGGCIEVARITTEGRIFYPGADTENAGLKLRIQADQTLENDGRWVLTGIANGVATWFRWNWAYVDLNLDSTTLPRLDGDISTSPAADLVLPFVQMIPARNHTLDTFVATIGPL
jgi:hypothetical protein